MLGVVLLVVAALRDLPAAEGYRRWRLLLTAPVDQRRLVGFWFSPPYLAFLDAIASHTGIEETIAIGSPPLPMYLYAAVYSLAPRRVVQASQAGDADAIATFESDPTVRGPGVRIANGWLSHR